jgi:osmoprotectant transport system permease protein
MTATTLPSGSLGLDSVGIGSLDWEWLSRNSDTVRADLVEHVLITFAALTLSLLVAVPVGLAAYRWSRTYPLVLGVSQVLYTIPSLALFVLLISIVGLGRLPVILGLTVYALVILVRSMVEALRAVPTEVTGAASAMGYRPTARLLAVELPLAVPAIIAGLRVAAVSTISLVSVGAVIGTGGLGQLFIHGFQIDNPIEIWAGLVATVLLALSVDLLLVAFGRACTPWARAAH